MLIYSVNIEIINKKFKMLFINQLFMLLTFLEMTGEADTILTGHAHISGFNRL